MTADEVDLVDEIFGLVPGESAGQPASPAPIGWESTSLAGSSVSVAPDRRPQLLNPVARQDPAGVVPCGRPSLSLRSRWAQSHP